MRKIAKFLLLCLPILSAGCSDDDVRYSIETPEDTLLLSVSEESVELKHNQKNDPAVTFTWQEPAKREGVSELSYYFKMDIADNSFATSIDKIEVTSSERTLSFTNKEMNDMLMAWGIAPGESAEIEAELIAQPENTDVYMKPVVSKVRFSVTSYSVQLYLVGSATPAGEDAANAILMKEVAAAQQYSWTGFLNPGKFYFPMSKDGTGGAYGRGDDDNHLAYKEDGNATPFEINHSGYYTLLLDLDAETISYEERVWMVGDATPNGWDLLQSTELERQAGSRVFKWKGLLTKGNLKFPLKVDEYVWEGPFLLADRDGTPAEGTSAIHYVEHCSPSADYRWYVSEMAIYEITLDLDKMTVRFDKESLGLPWSEIWMVGDATPGGWNSTPFEIKLKYDTSAPKGTFVWEGELTAGEIKFPLHENGFEGDYLMPPYGNAPITESRLVYSPEGNPDNKWKVNAAEAGIYKVSVNVISMTVNFEKQD